jgi:hypothetical protein
MSDTQTPKKPDPVLQLDIYKAHQKSPYYRMPGFFYELMRIGPGIPSTFWKLTFVMWQEVISPKKVPGAVNEYAVNWVFDTTYRQLKDDFQISKTASADFTHAYDISGLFLIKWGTKHGKDDAGTPTLWKYRTTATKRDWECFIVGLSDAYKTAREKHIARSGNFRPAPRNEKEFDDHINGRIRKVYGRMGFKMHLYFAINEARAEAGLPVVGTRFMNEMIESGYAKEGSDGLLHYEYKTTDRSRLESESSREPY